MVKLYVLTIVLALFPAVSAHEPAQKTDPAIEEFWAKFQAAVGRDDKASVIAMTGFPLTMPYGVSSIRTKTQLLKSYNKIFDTETRKCFAKAKPELDSGGKRRFSINCGEAMMYWFEWRKGQYKFVAVDNVNG